MDNLTEQWKKGELPSGWYYCYINNEEYKKLYYDGDCFELEDAETKNYYFFLPKDSENIIILALVPTFEEYQANENYIDYLKQCISVYESKDKQHTKDYLEYEETLKAIEQLEHENLLLKVANFELRNRLSTIRAFIKQGIDDDDTSFFDLLKKIEKVLPND